MTRPLAVTLLLFAALLGLCLLRYSPPAPRGVDTPADQFSAARAREIQRAISGSGASRELGSEANAKARALLEAELAKSGFTTEIQTAMSCSRHGACARVSNVVATRAGREPDAAGVLLMAHYDSVPCGPGASDDGAGTSAVVEAARALGSAPPLRRTVVVVLTDGEEAGLLGAEAFVRDHPLAKKVHGAVNVDARGTTGPSAMFETSPGNAWLVGVLARQLDRPVTSSLFYEIYRRMPNDTDFTAVKAQGFVQGVNFANIAKVERYHTPLDSFDDADPATLQHHGDQALAMVRALADAGPELDAPPRPGNDAVWFDVLATFIVRFPAGAALGLALAAFALVLGWTIRLRAWGLGLLSSPAALVAAGLAAFLTGSVLNVTGALPVPWVAHPLLALISLHGACITAGLTAARLVARDARAEVLWAGTWLTWGAIGVLTAVVAPGASFLFVVPAFVAGFVAWLRIELAAGIPALAAAVLWLPIALLAYDGVGLAVPVVASLPSLVLVSSLAPLGTRPSTEHLRRSGRPFALAAAAGVLVAVVAAAIAPKFSADKPQRVNVVFRQEEPAALATPEPARVHVEAAWAYMPWGQPPEPMMRVLGAESKIYSGAPTPWSPYVPFVQVARAPLAPPAATKLEQTVSPEGRRIRVRLESQRGARTIVLVLPTEITTTLVVEGHEAWPRNHAVVLAAVPAGGIEVELQTLGDHLLDVTIFDMTSGVPAADVAPLARALVDARQRETTAAQTQNGDLTIVSRRLVL